MRLKDIGYLYSGLTGKSGDDFNVEDPEQGNPFVPFTNIFNNFRIDVGAMRLVKMARGEAQNRVERGDLLFLMSSEDYESIGKPAVVDETVGELYLNSFCRGLRITRNEVLPDYVAYFLSAESVREILRLEARGFTRINLKVDRLASQEINLPSLATQRRIVSYLDEKTAAIDERVAVLGKKLAAYKRLKTSVINRAVTRGVPGWGERDNRDNRDERDESREPLATHCRSASGAKAQGRRVPEVAEVSYVPCHGRPVDRPLRDLGVDWIGKVPVGWRVTHLKRLTKKIGSGKTPSGGAEIYGTEGVMFLRSQNVYDNGLSLDDVAFISPEIDAEMASTRVVKGDVLLNITGGSIGRCCVYERSEPANVNQHVCIIRADKKLSDGAYIKYFWNSLGQEYLRLSQLGGNRESLNFEQIGNAPFPCPPFPEQRAIADYLDAECAKIDKMAALVTQEIALYKKLKRSLINEVVTGKREVA